MTDLKSPDNLLSSLKPEHEQIILKKMGEFRGLGTTLESALGALLIGQYFGWRVLKLIHNPSTYRKYEKILGVDFKDSCPEHTPMGEFRSVGYAITKKLESFWSVVMGRRKVPDKGFISDSKAEVDRVVKQFDK